MPSPKTDMYFDDSSIFRTVDASCHLFSNCSTLGDNLFTSIAINRGPAAAIEHALQHGWKISQPVVDYIRRLLLEEVSADPKHHDWATLLPWLESLASSEPTQIQYKQESSCDNTLYRTLKTLHCPRSRNLLMASLWSYCDESGTHADAAHTVVAGFFADG